MPAVLERKPARYQTHEDGEFVVFRSVPVWKEHTNSRDFDKPVHFGRRELERVCARCNERIDDTGDYVPVVLRHTGDGEDPPVVGLAGPFRIGTVGNKKPVPAILADLRIFKSDLERTKRYPRLSVEYWFAGSDPTNGYFDPISLLGAETPELDLGIRYGRQAHEGLQCLHYSKSRLTYQATVPAGSNTFVPGMVTVDDDDDPNVYAKERGKMPFSPEELAQLAETLGPMIEAKVAQLMPAAGAGDPLGGGAEMTPYQKLCKYMADGDDAGARDFLGSLDDEGKAKFQADLDSEADEEKVNYMKGLIGDDTPADEPTSMAGYRKRLAGERETAAKYRRERDEWKTKYSKLERDTKAMREELGELRHEQRKAVRYQKLREKLDEGFVFEVDEELENTSDFNDQQFERHLEKVVAKYQRAPIGGGLPYEQPPKREISEDEKKTAKYAKQAADLVQAERAKGVNLEYKAALEMVKSGKTKAE